MRTCLALAATLPLLACGDNDAAADSRAAADKIACATDGASGFDRVCSVERATGPEGLTLTLRSPSGSFRRLLVTRDGRGVVAADGADPAIVTPTSKDGIEVAIGGDRYRLPATVKP